MEISIKPLIVSRKWIQVFMAVGVNQGDGRTGVCRSTTLAERVNRK